LEKYPHVKGAWASRKEYFKLSPWQIFCTCNIYGFKNVKTGKRRFREVYVEVPRKNGKTFFVAGLGLIMLTEDGEFGAEVYCGAGSEKQAMEVFSPAKAICKREPDLRSHYGVEPNAKSIVILKNGSKFEPVIGDPGDGASPSCGIADEFHEHRNANLVDTFITGMGAREQPLMIYITTAGADMGSPCYEKRADIIQILKGAVEDDHVFGVIYTLDEDDQWDTIEAQKKANPNYGVSVSSEFLEGQLLQARRSASKQVAYKTKHLNLWVGAKAAWMNMLAFQACRKDITLESMKGQECYVALDLASRVDFASMAILFTGPIWKVFVKRYIPEDVMLENPRYKAWHAGGWITATPGNTIDYDYIADDLRELKSEYQIKEVPYDPFQATQFSIQMLEEGFPMIELGNTTRNLSEPMKELEAKVLNKTIQFQKDPALMWMFGNTIAREYNNDNIRPDKETKDNKIDDVVATIMAVGRAIVYEDKTSVYEKRGLLSF
jgi:phage terminase large subunit-like protein